MPIFEYACDDCGTKFEKLMRRTDAADLRCPSCGQAHLTTQYSTFAPHSAAPKQSQPAAGCGGGMCQGGMCGMDSNQAPNTPQFSNPSGSLTSGNFGHITGVTISGSGVNGGGGRALQLGAKFSF